MAATLWRWALSGKRWLRAGSGGRKAGAERRGREGGGASFTYVHVVRQEVGWGADGRGRSRVCCAAKFQGEEPTEGEGRDFRKSGA